ncbi:MAG: PQQ-binding-like beta-propeller repeat protein [Phycisphaerae bacterium]|nr:PQQ-binding-like beta-propeller repeat protein [Phycisphaerae bacterium]
MYKSKQQDQIDADVQMTNFVSGRNVRRFSNTLWGHSKPAMALLVTLAILISSGCGRPAPKITPPVDTAALELLTIPRVLLSRAGLHEEWNLPKVSLGLAQKINQIFYWDGKLFVIDNYCNLYAIDGKNGITLWRRSLSQIQATCSAPEFYQDHLLFVVGNTIMEIRANDGEVIHSVKLNFSPSTTVTRNKDSYFLGGHDKRFYCLEIEGGIKNWQSIQPSTPVGHVQVYAEPLDEKLIDEATGQPVIPFEKIFYTDETGGAYVSLTDKREKVWIYESTGKTPGVIVDKNQCFLPSSDTILYCFNSSDGQLRWRYMASKPLFEMPALCNEYLYQSVGFDSLVCLNRQSNVFDGSEVWKLNNGKTMLAENGPLCYALTYDNELTIMNNLTGQHQMSFYVPGVEMAVANTKDSMIFLATRRGTIVALKPNRQEIFHRATPVAQNDATEKTAQ